MKKLLDGVLVDMTALEISERQSELDSWDSNAFALNALRDERNQRLANTDWWVMPDRTATQAQLDYRQALRDITNTYSSLDDVVWPEKPE